MYRKVAAILEYTYREPLPDCVVAAIRNLFPAIDGIYVGYREPHINSGGGDSDSDSD
eukprot:COSAG01_NODE_1685_length_9495_cov_61.609728_1_plen_57_part_00